MWLAKVHLGCSLIDCQVLPALATWQLVPMQPGRKIADNHSRRGTNNHTAWETNNNTSSGWIIEALGVVHVYFHADVVRGQPMIRMGKPSIITLARSILTAGYYSPTCCRHSQKKIRIKTSSLKGSQDKKLGWVAKKKKSWLRDVWSGNDAIFSRSKWLLRNLRRRSAIFTEEVELALESVRRWTSQPDWCRGIILSCSLNAGHQRLYPCASDGGLLLYWSFLWIRFFRSNHMSGLCSGTKNSFPGLHPVLSTVSQIVKLNFC